MSSNPHMGEGKAAVCDLCNGIGYLGENECPRCNTAVGDSRTAVESVDRGRWGRELARVAEQVRLLPPREQRSFAIRGIPPLRHSETQDA